MAKKKSKYKQRIPTVDAVLWEEHGDDASVGVFSESPWVDDECSVCGRHWSEHGRLEEPGHPTADVQAVCPGSYLFDHYGFTSVLPAEQFEAMYEGNA